MLFCIHWKEYVVTKNIHDNIKLYYKKRKKYESENVENRMLYVLKYNKFTLEQLEITWRLISVNIGFSRI